MEYEFPMKSNLKSKIKHPLKTKMQTTPESNNESVKAEQIKSEFERLFSKSDLSCDNETSSFDINICGDMGNTLAYDNVEIQNYITKQTL